MTAPVPDHSLDVVAWITVRYHANGGLSVQGTIGDARVARQLLDHAKDAIGRQLGDRQIVVPNRDVDVEPSSLLKPLGDVPAGERGDP
jgi:hypothetical protein